MTEFKTAKQVGDLMGLSVKALRLYEARGLISPGRTSADWRVYGPEEISALHKIQSLKLIGFSLSAIGELLTKGLAVEEVLEAQESVLIKQQANVASALAVIRQARQKLSVEQCLSTDDLIELTQETKAMSEFEWTEAHEALARKHHTPEQMEHWRNRKTSPEFEAEMIEYGRQWQILIDRAEVLRHGAPDVPEAFQLLKEWDQLSAEFSGGDETLHKATGAWYEDGFSNPQTEQLMPFSKEVWMFVNEVRKAAETTSS